MNYRYMLYNVAFSSDVRLELPSALTGQETRIDISEMQSDQPGSADDFVAQTVRDEWTASHLYNSGAFEIEWRDWLSLWVSPDGRTAMYRVVEQT